MNDVITFRGNKNKWFDFINKLKKDKKIVWQVMEKWIEKYVK